MKPVIVDLLPEDKTIIPFLPGVPVIGKFHQQASNLSYSLALTRAMGIKVIILNKVQIPRPLTFYIDECWQAFAIIADVAGYFKVTPRVLVLKNGEIIDLIDFYSQGGDDSVGSSKSVLFPNPNQPHNGGAL